MYEAGATTVKVFPSFHYNGWQGDIPSLRNRLLSVIDTDESPYYGDVAANIVDLALSAPTTPRSSSHFLANLRLDRLKAMYQNNREQLQRVLHLNKDLVKQVEMRYQVFFRAMEQQLDGTLDYADADAVYLRVRGFTLRNEAPRLGRFLISDFMHYISERRRPGVQTLFVIDEYGALRLREETSILFEQTRSFGGCLLISAQGYATLGPREYAERVLDATNAYVVHACSDPFNSIKRAGKRLYWDVTWSEDEEGNPHRSIRPRWDWKILEPSVIQQETGQSYWIHEGRTQQIQTAQISLTQEQIQDAWREIRRQEDIQRQLSEVAEQRHQSRKARKDQSPDPDGPSPSAWPASQKKKVKANSSSTATKTPKPQRPAPTGTAPSPAPTTIIPLADQKKAVFFYPDPTATPDPTKTSPRVPPTPDPDDDEPDRL